MGLNVVSVVEALSVPILAAFVLAQPRAARGPMLRDALVIGLGAVLGEETCIAFYRFYAYSPAWSVKAVAVPVMVGCIWPAVVLSARQVVARLTQHPGRRALGVALLVLADATLVEAVSVRCGLWAWEEGAVFGVPVIGLVGWSAYAGLACAALDRGWPAWARLLAPAAGTHVVLLAAWWGGLRWGLRAPVAGWVLPWVSAAAALVATLFLRRHRGAVPLAIMGPRALAAALFFVLVAWAGATDGAGWLAVFVVPFAPPYLWLTSWRAARAG
ncbi:MAG: carotenoid biosynthesis protein [Deltaproteobacteria bacterium]|nr:carotenoid biosynthesis protein [Deltaproteobacteria bacterium]